jgi:uncharacterized protein (TIGR00369 family)
MAAAGADQAPGCFDCCGSPLVECVTGPCLAHDAADDRGANWFGNGSPVTCSLMAGSLTEEQQVRRRQAVVELMPSTPYMGWLGIVFDRYEPDDVTIRLPFREDLTNDGTYYGGVIAAVMDTAGAAAAWSNHDFEKGTRASTISMTINYVGAAKRSDLICRARTVRRRKELTFTEITATDSDGNVVAHAVQTYRLGG